MKKIISLFVLLGLLVPKIYGQDGAALAAVAVGLAVAGTVVSIDMMQEAAELKATEYVLNKHPEMTSFSLKTLDFDGKKAKDMSSATLITYKIQEFQLADKPELNGKKMVLFGFTSYGWVTDYGVDFSKVHWIMVDAEEWMRMMVVYVKTASSERDDSSIRERLKTGKVVNNGIKEGFETTIPFYKLEGDMYTVRDYNNTMKLVYNERSLGIYLKPTFNLIQIGRGDVIKIHDFFYGED